MKPDGRQKHSYILRGLDQDRNYTIYVTATTVVEGPPSERSSVFLDQDAITVSVQGVTTKVLNSTTVLVSWSRDNLKGVRVEGFEVHWRDQYTSVIVTNIPANSSSNKGKPGIFLQAFNFHYFCAPHYSAKITSFKYIFIE